MEVQCPQCSVVLRVADQHVGKRGRCVACQTVIPLVPRVQIEPSEPFELESAAPAKAGQTAAAQPVRQLARGEYRAMVGIGIAPKGAKRCPLTGKTEVRFAGPHAYVGGILHKPGKTALHALLLTAVTVPVVFLLAAAFGWAVGPGFGLWYLMLDKMYRTEEEFRLNPAKLRADYDPKRRRFRMELPDGTWACGRMRKEPKAGRGAFQRHMEAAYGENLRLMKIPVTSTAVKVIGLTLLGMFVITVVAAMIGIAMEGPAVAPPPAGLP